MPGHRGDRPLADLSAGWASGGRLPSPAHLCPAGSRHADSAACCHWVKTRHDQVRQQEPRSWQPFYQSAENQIQIKKLDIRITKLGRDVFIPVEDDLF